MSKCHLIPVSNAFEFLGFDLSNLQRIDISYNAIKTLPDFVYELKVLKELWISNNPISQLSSKISSCEALEVLDIHDTEIKVFFFKVDIFISFDRKLFLKFGDGLTILRTRIFRIVYAF